MTEPTQLAMGCSQDIIYNKEKEAGNRRESERESENNDKVVRNLLSKRDKFLLFTDESRFNTHGCTLSISCYSE